MFLLIPDESNERVLHTGKVLESDAGSFVAEFEEELAPAAGLDVNVFAEVRGRFMQQGAKVAAIQQGGGKPVIAFRREGTPCSAESRSIYRVSVATAGIYAKVGTLGRFLVVDMSPEGFAVVSQVTLPVGTLQNVCIEFEGQSLGGQARVQTVKRLPNGTFRYGFRAADNPPTMRRTLQHISAAVQRMQLRRLARSA